MTFDMLLKLLGVASPMLAILTFIIGQKNGLRKNSYDEGVKDANITNALDNLATKIEAYAKNTVQREEFGEWKNRVKILENIAFGDGKNGS